MNTVCLSSFETPGKKIIRVVQGEFAISGDREALMTTILGSCIAVCLCDPVARIGGINHFLLPGDGDGASGTAKYGAFAMEQLVNALLRGGASRSRLEAKVFGGGRVVSGLSDIGERNAAFALNYLSTENIRVVSKSVEGERARRIEYVPTTGSARQKFVDSRQAPAVKPKMPVAPPTSGDVDFF
ncbi:chemotaxis protein CheD [Parvularcula bermudensis HTCC2503]|uniref:Probable chemoreceptor glutamine deamidase CheD n=1 Tax=Parvularcula bermudensis (strain ATCC BAA-594 / HTCC2503 / KCTC 12087) TaxID=314260 RepID=E0TFX3_PARBH|nr:chemotaxis protein CheD [Parvularcula bermudensis]ADM09572.1 chemotaxis protein CheD [Parvularcula bermudensis HTCC2503]